jgi:hypothetical protein
LGNNSFRNKTHRKKNFFLKKNELSNLREIFKKMLLFGKLKEDPVKELIEYIVKENRVNDFSDFSSLNEQVFFVCFLLKFIAQFCLLKVISPRFFCIG